MAIPDYQTLMLPLLRHLGDQQDKSTQETVEALAKEFDLTEQEQTKLLPSGRQPLFTNRIAWAKAYLKKAGLIESPAFFERVVVDLLVKMGYGGTHQDAGRAIGKSGDEGIDGIIKEDHLGLDVIYVQAKRWEGTVGRPEIQKFVGALQGQRARKGVFITTSVFSSEAKRYASTIQTKVVLVDGKRLAKLMIDHGVGVSDMAAYTLKRVDSDYFEE